MTDRITVRDRIKTAAMLVLSRPLVSRLVGRLTACTRPRWMVRRLIRWYIRKMDIDLRDVKDPVDRFSSLSHFFIRELKPGARPIAPDPLSLASPVDAEVMTAAPVCEGDRAYQIKGSDYCLSELLPPEFDPAAVPSMQVLQLYLSPKDYHRIHFPVDGRVTGAWFRRGRLLPVNHFSLTHFSDVLIKNERVILHIETDHGAVVLALIGALNVGRIGLTFSDFVSNRNWRRTSGAINIRDHTAKKGAELGHFLLGSTVVMMVPESVTLSVRPGDRVRMGQEIGRWPDRSET